jgi:hypothetical protein
MHADWTPNTDGSGAHIDPINPSDPTWFRLNGNEPVQYSVGSGFYTSFSGSGVITGNRVEDAGFYSGAPLQYIPSGSGIFGSGYYGSGSNIFGSGYYGSGSGGVVGTPTGGHQSGFYGGPRYNKVSET